MAVTSASRPWRRYISTGGATFTVPFQFDSDSELRVYLAASASATPVLQVDGVDYNASGAGSSSGGSIVFTSAPAAGSIVTVYRAKPISRATDFTTGGSLSSSSLDSEFDKKTLIEQDRELDTYRALKVPLTEDVDAVSAELGAVTGKGGYFLRLNATATGFEWVEADVDGNLPSVIDGGTW